MNKTVYRKKETIHFKKSDVLYILYILLEGDIGIFNEIITI